MPLRVKWWSMAGGSSGSAERNVTVPALLGWSRTTASVRPSSVGCFNPLLLEQDRREHELEVGRGEARLRPHEGCRLTDVGGERPQPEPPGDEVPERLGGGEGVLAPATRAKTPVRQVVDEVLPHPGRRGRPRRPRARARIRRARCRRAAGAGGCRSLPRRGRGVRGRRPPLPPLGRLAVQPVRDAPRTTAPEQDARRDRLRDDREIGPAQSRAQVAVDDAEAAPAALRDPHVPDASVVLAVEVVRVGDPDCLGRVHERFRQDVAVTLLGEGERGRPRSSRRRARRRSGPARATHRGPRLVVGRVPPEHHVAFIPVEPPTMRPRGNTISRPSSSACGTVESPQSRFVR